MKILFKLFTFVGFLLIIPSFYCFSQEIKIGAKYGGGIIFYIDATGNHGLIAADVDQGSAYHWGCSGISIGGTHGAIGQGQSNSTNIENGCNDDNKAVSICHNLELNGFHDWFLPSKGELNQMYIQKAVIGDFTNTEYWSSTEEDIYSAWVQDFTNGHQESSPKNSLKNVRAVRAF
jgi:hypothetical protein